MEIGAACIFHICRPCNSHRTVFLFFKCSSSIWKILTDVGDGLLRCWNNKNRASLRLESICLFYSKFSSKTLLGRRVPDESLQYHSWLIRFTPNFVHSLCCEKKTLRSKVIWESFCCQSWYFFCFSVQEIF